MIAFSAVPELRRALCTVCSPADTFLPQASGSNMPTVHPRLPVFLSLATLPRAFRQVAPVKSWDPARIAFQHPALALPLAGLSWSLPLWKPPGRVWEVAAYDWHSGDLQALIPAHTEPVNTPLISLPLVYGASLLLPLLWRLKQLWTSHLPGVLSAFWIWAYFSVSSSFGSDFCVWKCVIFADCD